MAGEATLYCNATIYTMANELRRTEAMLVRDGRVEALGSTPDLKAGNTNLKIVDLEGQTVVPGFNDCHCHILGLGMELDAIDLSPPSNRSIADIQRKVAERVARAPGGEWIIGAGYDQNELVEHRHPTRHDLDTVAAGHPVVLRHTSHHVLTCNSRALELAGIGADHDSPDGGEIVRDEDGEPSGILKEGAGRLVEDHIPLPTLEQGAEAVLRATQHMARFGITSATDLSTGHGPSPDYELECYRRAVAWESRRVRIGLTPQITYVAPPDSDAVLSHRDFLVGEDAAWLAINGTKVFADGAMSTRTAALRWPYNDSPDDFGMLLWDRDTLTHMMRRAHRAGWQIAAHALGDRAVEEVLAVYEDILRIDPRSNHRHRVEHCMVVDDELVGRMKVLDVVPVIQPDIFRLGDGYVAALGMERASQLIPMRTFARNGLATAFSSDAPVVTCNPLEVIRSAMERRTPSGVILGLEHSVSALEAIRHYTVDAAYATQSEATKGSLRPGMMADFTVLSEDPTGSPPSQLDAIRVTRTVAGGVTSFQA